MPVRVVGFSNKYVKFQCEMCNSKKAQIVQRKSYLLSIKSINIFGLGNREFGLLCDNCGLLRNLQDNQVKAAEKLKYSRHPSGEGQSADRSLTESSKNKKYPVLTEERRQKIKKNNYKEGLISMSIGIPIGLILYVFDILWVKYLGLGIVIFSLFGGLYGMFEDPENNHRNFIDHHKEI